MAIGAVFNFCLYGAIFCLAIDLRQAHGLDALDTGLALLPMTIVTGTMAFISGRVIPCAGEWRVILAGLAAGATGALLVALNTSRGPLAALIASSVPLGFTALAMPAMTGVAMTHAPRHRIGLASGVFNASRGRVAAIQGPTMAFDITAWSDYGVAVVAGAGALTGLLFVAAGARRRGRCDRRGGRSVSAPAR